MARTQQKLKAGKTTWNSKTDYVPATKCVLKLSVLKVPVGREYNKNRYIIPSAKFISNRACTDPQSCEAQILHNNQVQGRGSTIKVERSHCHSQNRDNHDCMTQSYRSKYMYNSPVAVCKMSSKIRLFEHPVTGLILISIISEASAS